MEAQQVHVEVPPAQRVQAGAVEAPAASGVPPVHEVVRQVQAWVPREQRAGAEAQVLVRAEPPAVPSVLPLLQRAWTQEAAWRVPAASGAAVPEHAWDQWTKSPSSSASRSNWAGAQSVRGFLTHFWYAGMALVSVASSDFKHMKMMVLGPSRSWLT